MLIIYSKRLPALGHTSAVNNIDSRSRHHGWGYSERSGRRQHAA